MITQGTTAPDFILETDSGAKVTLSELRGRQVVLFFYPKDDTPGCTIECKEFRDAAPKFEGKALGFGVSADDHVCLCQFLGQPIALGRSWISGNNKATLKQSQTCSVNSRPCGSITPRITGSISPRNDSRLLEAEAQVPSSTASQARRALSGGKRLVIRHGWVRFSDMLHWKRLGVDKPMLQGNNTH